MDIDDDIWDLVMEAESTLLVDVVEPNTPTKEQTPEELPEQTPEELPEEFGFLPGFPQSFPTGFPLAISSDILQAVCVADVICLMLDRAEELKAGGLSDNMHIHAVEEAVQLLHVLPDIRPELRARMKKIRKLRKSLQ